MVTRDKKIDILRGLAIFTMIAANISPYVLIEPHPFWFRLYGSFAAPLFNPVLKVFPYFNSQNTFNISF